MQVEIDDITFDKFIVQDLENHAQDLCLSNYEVPMFSYDQKEEKRKTKKLRKALMIVAAYYGSKEYNLDTLLK